MRGPSRSSPKSSKGAQNAVRRQRRRPMPTKSKTKQPCQGPWKSVTKTNKPKQLRMRSCNRWKRMPCWRKFRPMLCKWRHRSQVKSKNSNLHRLSARQRWTSRRRSWLNKSKPKWSARLPQKWKSRGRTLHAKQPSVLQNLEHTKTQQEKDEIEKKIEEEKDEAQAE